MASLLFITSSTSITTTSAILHHLCSSFKGNSRILKQSSSLSPSIKLTSKRTKPRTPFVILNQVADVSGAPIEAATTRFRLNNLGLQPGSRKNRKRKGRGHAAGQGGSCGFGMRGQKSRSGPGVRKGFEGGQMPLYRRLPKLRGISGEAAGFEEGEEVSIESLKKKGIINPSGRERRLPLKILGDGDLKVKHNFKARAFSASAKEKLEAAGCSLTVLPGRKKWVKPSVAKNLARAEEYFAKRRAASSDSA
ncbi:hypothetical protein RND71_010597 [Anisodus tanguticus]|uniref:Large ribosomal subunit protein uL15/eL18 domain-containing protein n=1 Tax=Anisodus tanguticus TaxID=243964 RepID=A0AAE1VJ96_9SOLA|nr:hypothetical protein RND71_010597 [Anisodus tanguticus]